MSYLLYYLCILLFFFAVSSSSPAKSFSSFLDICSTISTEELLEKIEIFFCFNFLKLIILFETIGEGCVTSLPWKMGISMLKD